MSPAPALDADLDAAAVADRHPRVCQVDIVGFAGERADVPGHDLTYQAEAGLRLTGESQTPTLSRALGRTCTAPNRPSARPSPC